MQGQPLSHWRPAGAQAEQRRLLRLPSKHVTRLVSRNVTRIAETSHSPIDKSSLDHRKKSWRRRARQHRGRNRHVFVFWFPRFDKARACLMQIARDNHEIEFTLARPEIAHGLFLRLAMKFTFEFVIRIAII